MGSNPDYVPRRYQSTAKRHCAWLVAASTVGRSEWFIAGMGANAYTRLDSAKVIEREVRDA
jgi:hypothetical protein